MHVRVMIPALITAIAMVACGSGEEVSTGDTARLGRSPEAAAVEPVAEEVSAGIVVFELDGEVKRFDHLATADNMHTSVSSAIKARPSAGSGESLGIIFLSLDLKKVTFPADLPAPRDMSKPMDPMTAMASIGFSYIDESGQEWAGPGRIHVQAFGTDGVVQGAFTDVSLPHTDNERPNIVLTGGRFRARISSPW